MSCGNKAELAIELEQTRFWQTLDKRFALMAFCTFVGDQHASRSLKAVLRRRAPGDLYRVCRYCAPIRQSATSDIGRRNVNDRWKGRTKARRLEADVAQSLC